MANYLQFYLTKTFPLTNFDVPFFLRLMATKSRFSLAGSWGSMYRTVTDATDAPPTVA